MMATQKREKRNYAPAAVLLACGIALCSIVAFGNPTLWMTAAQSEALKQEADPGTQLTVPVESEPSPLEGLQVIGEYKAISQSNDEARSTNITLMSDAIDGAIVQPGETFSFNALAGDTENDERYQMAPVVYGNEMTLGRGGGICQVSTALYVAALKADLEIVERYPHSLVVDYAPIGLDATLVYGQLDLRIKNNTNKPFVISAEAEGQSVTVKIYGEAKEAGTSIDATSQVIEAYGIAAEQHVGEGGTLIGDDAYYIVESYKVYYDRGNKKQSELLSTDRYGVIDSSKVALTEGSTDPTK